MFKPFQSHQTSGVITEPQRGFSLVELMVVVALMAILAGVAAPSFKSMIENYRVSGVTDSLTSALELTRATAIQMNGNVSIAKIAGGACSTDADWSCGWRVFLDTDGDGNFDSGETLIQDFAADGKVTVTRSVNSTFMMGNRWGQLNGINAAGFVLIPYGESTTSPAGKLVCMNAGGRIRTLKSEEYSVCP
jgi:type IV fimbrial biogenesis protein FimT